MRRELEPLRLRLQEMGQRAVDPAEVMQIRATLADVDRRLNELTRRLDAETSSDEEENPTEPLATDVDLVVAITRRLHEKGYYGGRQVRFADLRRGNLSHVDHARLYAACKRMANEGVLNLNRDLFSLVKAKKAKIQDFLAKNGIPAAPDTKPQADAPSAPNIDLSRFVERGYLDNSLAVMRERIEAVHRLASDVHQGTDASQLALLQRSVAEMRSSVNQIPGLIAKVNELRDAPKGVNPETLRVMLEEIAGRIAEARPADDEPEDTLQDEHNRPMWEIAADLAMRFRLEPRFADLKDPLPTLHRHKLLPHVDFYRDRCYDCRKPPTTPTFLVRLDPHVHAYYVNACKEHAFDQPFTVVGTSIKAFQDNRDLLGDLRMFAPSAGYMLVSRFSARPSENSLLWGATSDKESAKKLHDWLAETFGSEVASKATEEDQHD